MLPEPALPDRLWHDAMAAVNGDVRQRGTPSAQPVGSYLDAGLHARELALLRTLPCPAAVALSLPEPGSWQATTVHGLPVLLVRGDDGVARAFFNVCRHRGAALCAPGSSGSGRGRFVCPYHSWTYDTHGACVGRPHETDFAHLGRDAARLVELPCHERLGLLWVIAHARGAPFDWDGWFGPLTSELESMGYGTLTWAPHERGFDHPANWKLVIEGNLESYHFQYAHRDTIAHLFHDNLVVHQQLGDHQRIVLPKRSMAGVDASGLPAGAAGAADAAAAAADLLGRHAHVIRYLFPCTLALWEGDHVNLFTVSPIDTGRCTVRGWMLVPGHLRERRAAAHWRKNHDLFWAALDEDFALAASIQAGLHSGANSELRFGANEFACAAFRQSLDRALDRQAGVREAPEHG